MRTINSPKINLSENRKFFNFRANTPTHSLNQGQGSVLTREYFKIPGYSIIFAEQFSKKDFWKKLYGHEIYQIYFWGNIKSIQVRFEPETIRLESGSTTTEPSSR